MPVLIDVGRCVPCLVESGWCWVVLGGSGRLRCVCSILGGSGRVWSVLAGSKRCERFWVALVVVAAVLAAGAVVSRLRTFFDSDKPYIGAALPADEIKPIPA